MNDNQIQLARVLAAKVRSDPDGNLALPDRKLLTRTLGPWRMTPEGNKAIFGLGLCRRTQVGVVVTQRVLPIWNSYFTDFVQPPQEMLTLARSLLLGRAKEDQIKKEGLRFQGWLHNALDIPLDQQYRLQVGWAAVMTLWRSRSDDALDPEQNNRTDQDFNVPWDPAFYAMDAWVEHHAGKGPTADHRRAFWLWYLDEAVPQALREGNALYLEACASRGITPEPISD